MKTKNNLPKRFYYQLNSKSPVENYIEQKEDLIKSYQKRKANKKAQEQDQKLKEKILEKSIDKEVHKQLDKFFSTLSK